MEPTTSEARARVLAAAEKLFSERGYAAVTIRDIAAAVGIRHTSLYYHAPGGKEQLFVEVMERNLRRHQQGLEQAVADAAPHVQAQLYAAAEWLLAQPPLDMLRMTHADMPAIEEREGRRLMKLAADALLQPFTNVLLAAQVRGEINHPNLGIVGAGIFAMVESLHAIPAHVPHSRPALARDLIDVMLNGLRPSSTTLLPQTVTATHTP